MDLQGTYSSKPATAFELSRGSSADLWHVRLVIVGLHCKQKIGVKKVWVRESEIGEDQHFSGVNFLGGPD